MKPTQTVMPENYRIRHYHNEKNEPIWDVIDDETGLVVERNGKPYIYENQEQKENDSRFNKMMRKAFIDYFCSENYVDNDTEE